MRFSIASSLIPRNSRIIAGKTVVPLRQLVICNDEALSSLDTLNLVSRRMLGEGILR